MNSPERARHPLHRYLYAVALVIVSMCYVHAFVTAGSSLKTAPFRESQTAIATREILRGGPWLAYHIPVFGSPWGVPFEFPFYQLTVAAIGYLDASRLISLPLVGKLTSLLSWGGCLALSYRLLSRIRNHLAFPPLDVTLLIAAMPVYVVYSTALMIESMALLLSLAFVETYLYARETTRFVAWIPVTAATIAAALIKPTTWAPWAGMLLLLESHGLVFSFFRRSADTFSALRRFTTLAGLLIFSYAIAIAWTHYADGIKSQNALAADLVMNGTTAWNYGTYEQKLSLNVWLTIAARLTFLTIGPLGILAAAYKLLTPNSTNDRKSDDFLITLLLAAGICSAPVIFTNLYFRHDYYLYAVGGLLATFFSVTLNARRSTVQRSVAHQLVFILVLISECCLSVGYATVRHAYEDPAIDAVASRIRTLDAPGAAIMLGYGWSPQIAFQTNRNAIMINVTDPSNPRVTKTIENNENTQIAIVLVCSEAYDRTAAKVIENLAPQLTRKIPIYDNAFAYISESTAKSFAPLQVPEAPPAVLRGLKPTRNIAYRAYFPNGKLTPCLEISVRRNLDLFHFTAFPVKFTRYRDAFAPP